ncbi:MAG: hypothetical protein AAF213_02345 [Pseudomonadota bacterium]
MSILDQGTTSLNDVIFGQAAIRNAQLFSTHQGDGRDTVAGLFPALAQHAANQSALNQSTDTSQKFDPSPENMAAGFFTHGDENIAQGFAQTGVSAVIKRTSKTADSGYPALGQWGLQLGEAMVADEAPRLFLNIVDPLGAIVLQLHGIATDRNFGDMCIHGGDWDHQLQVYAFAGDFFGDVPRFLHRPFAVGDHVDAQVLLGSLADLADHIADANVDFMPTTLDSACDTVADAQNENSVIRSLLSVVSAQYPDFPIHDMVGWHEPAGFMRDLGQAVARPFGGMDEQAALPSAPKGRVPSFSAKNLDAWFAGLRDQAYQTVVEPGIQHWGV